MDVIVGVSFTFVTVSVKLCVSTVLDPSVAVRTILWSPTSLFEGVPDKTPVVALKVNQSGFVDAANVSVSPTSTSEATNV